MPAGRGNRRRGAGLALAIAVTCNIVLGACGEGNRDAYVLDDYALATGTFEFDARSTVEVVYDLSAIAANLPGAEGVEQLADAGPTRSKTNITGVATVEVTADGANRTAGVRFSEADGELSGALGTSPIGADDLTPQSFTFTPSGDVTSGKGGANAGLPGIDLGRAFSCPPLPEGGATSGERWEAEVELPVAGGGTATATTASSLELRDVRGVEAARVMARLDEPVTLRIDAALLTQQLQIPNAPVAPPGIELAVTAELDVTVTCDLGIPDKTLLSRAVDSSMTLSFALPPEVSDPAAAGVAAIFVGLRIANTEDTRWSLRD
ncbi:MAG: hypothetical protein IT198_14375 [Acidimicrobiia bacterium]|nr:hypothetical protein [Acidimicrobiia bacterium]